MRADFHIHTTASDGLFTPREVAEAAALKGLSAVALTDHDTVYNLKEFNTYCKMYDLKPVAGVEISAYVCEVKIHILGYGFDPENRYLKEFFGFLREGSEMRAVQIIEKLNALGVNLTFREAAAERLCADTPLHAMHIARAAVKKGYGKDRFAFYKRYLMYGRPAFSNIFRPSPEETVEAINAAGGIAVIAHPGRVELNKADLRYLIMRLASEGLGGIEAVYSTHTVIETAYFKELAEDLGLLVTGGSDAHFGGGNRMIGEPEFQPSAELRQRLNI